MNRKISLIIIVVLTIAILSSYTYYKTNIIGNIEFEEIEKTNENLGIIERPEVIYEEPSKEIPKEKIYRVALLGIDSRGRNDRGRSDAIMVVSLNTKTKEIKLASFLRDIKVNINGKRDKLNHAYAYDGGVGILRTLNSNFDLDITDYATVNMFNLSRVIDKIGGVTVDIKPNEIREINRTIKEVARLENKKSHLITETGVQELSGDQTVGYMRIRNTGSGDIARTGRQREVLELLIKELSNKNILEVLDIVSEASKLVSTSLTEKEIESMIVDILPILKTMTINGEVFPNGDQAKSDMSTGIFYWELLDEYKFITEIKNYFDY